MQKFLSDDKEFDDVDAVFSDPSLLACRMWFVPNLLKSISEAPCLGLFEQCLRTMLKWDQMPDDRRQVPS